MGDFGAGKNKSRNESKLNRTTEGSVDTTRLQEIISKYYADNNSTRNTSSTSNASGTNQLSSYDPARPSIDSILGKAGSIFDQAVGSQYGPANLITPFAKQTNQAFDSYGAAAKSANPVVQSAASANQSLTDGSNKFLQGIGASNPFDSQIYNQGAERVSDRLKGEFGGGNMVGGSRHQNALGQGLGYYTADYARQQQQLALQAAGIQNNAANSAGGVARNLGIPGAILEGVGGAVEKKRQDRIDSEVQRTQYQNDRGLNVLNSLLPALTQTGATFGKQQSNQNTQVNELQKLLESVRGGSQENSTMNELRNFIENLTQTGLNKGKGSNVGFSLGFE